MFIVGRKEMRLMDQYTIERIGLPGIVLMENAGAKVVEEILANTPCKNPRIIVLAGGGNNGGDGVVIARRLCDLGLKPLLCLLVNPDHITGDAKTHLDVYRNRKLPIFYLQEDNLVELRSEIIIADIVIDAILGTGMTGPVRNPLNEVISIVNEYSGKKLVIAVDIPSGVSSDNGIVESVAIRATKTISFVLPKTGFFLSEGPQYVGDWKAVDISVPCSIVEDLGLLLPQLITQSLVNASIPCRPLHGHKGTFGHVLVVGGSREYVGAPAFAAKSALHSGAGLVTLAIPESVYPMVASQVPEALFLSLPEEKGHFSTLALDDILPKFHQFNSIAIGPGMGRFPGGEEWLTSFITALSDQTIVIDADALYLLRNRLDVIRQYKGDVIFTPHPGEMAGLLDTTIEEIELDRIDIAKRFAKDNNVYLLLKGHRSVIATPQGDIYINPVGHDALGKGGSGDVLTGLIASFIAQGASPINALVSASYLHAKAGEEKAEIISHYGVMPSDIIDGIKSLLLESFIH